MVLEKLSNNPRRVKEQAHLKDPVLVPMRINTVVDMVYGFGNGKNRQEPQPVICTIRLVQDLIVLVVFTRVGGGGLSGEGVMYLNKPLATWLYFALLCRRSQNLPNGRRPKVFKSLTRVLKTGAKSASTPMMLNQDFFDSPSCFVLSRRVGGRWTRWKAQFIS